MSLLPRPMPPDPLPLVQQWLDDGEALPKRNPFALALATAGEAGEPAVRYVLLKGLSIDHGYIVFYTNYGSRKAREIDASGRAAAAIYWEELGRQIRFEGRAARSPADESDAYFSKRPRGSQLNAWASEQSRPLPDPAAMVDRLEARRREFADRGSIPRPPFWGGYRLWLAAVELWVEGDDRFHERARFERTLETAGDGRFRGGPWRLEYLQP